jgi:hypothetical protein
VEPILNSIIDFMNKEIRINNVVEANKEYYQNESSEV